MEVELSVRKSAVVKYKSELGGADEQTVHPGESKNPIRQGTGSGLRTVNGVYTEAQRLRG